MLSWEQYYQYKNCSFQLYYQLVTNCYDSETAYNSSCCNIRWYTETENGYTSIDNRFKILTVKDKHKPKLVKVQLIEIILVKKGE